MDRADPQIVPNIITHLATAPSALDHDADAMEIDV